MPMQNRYVRCRWAWPLLDPYPTITLKRDDRFAIPQLCDRFGVRRRSELVDPPVHCQRRRTAQRGGELDDEMQEQRATTRNKIMIA
jgi:hypothetical protein